MKRKIVLCLFLTLAFVLMSCSTKTKEEKVIERMDSLIANVENKSQTFDEKDWENVSNELESIHNDMNDCNFSNEQLQQIGKKDGKIMALITRQGFKTLGDQMKNVISIAGGFASGFKEGIEDALNEDDLKQFGEDINNELQNIMKDMNGVEKDSLR